MKSLSIYFLFFCSLTLFFSCSDDEDNEPYQPPYSEEDIQDEISLKSYLQQSFPSAIERVSVTDQTVEIKGKSTGEGDFYLVEIPPYEDVTQIKEAPYKTKLEGTPFTVKLDRMVERGGITYDRLLSKWAVFKTEGTTGKLVSHARYADDIPVLHQLQPVPLTTKKGIGGIFVNQFISDLTLLGTSSGTLNLTITRFLHLTPKDGYSEYTYGGKTYYIDMAFVEGTYDTMLKETTKDRNLSIAAILLIEPAAQAADPAVGALLQHPDYEKGAFTMPDMSNPEAVNCYAAALDFLAKRYCTPDNRYGRISHWIMHNEIDGSIDWTNMGVRPVTLVTDAYMKSMRLCYNIVRQYDNNAEVFASFSHSWTAASNPGWHTTREIVDLINDYSRAEGDFQWAMACHSYPEDVYNPRTWDDPNATYSMDTKFVTFKNLEVLSKWALAKENKYKGTIKRSVWLSEAGVNSPTYSDQDLLTQAAGVAYAWKKINGLPGIDGIQWHNWFDHPDEGGARLGLRKFPQTDNAETKPSWFVFQKAGTEEEDSYFQQFLPVIGISDWNVIENF
ncbi:hypothetical protein GGR21_001677 [Dysgonomonas hofstadii]|uniref:DUF5722 domain-containing protein n=1 Tax=Dysgonomonas hofstadii TaxID=637886 RepID=A0A840CTC5_9BACT|nr:DUF5722 domain-containing protein [Dysgonomonas hofstadii]MBB4035782.1 hypothetical protein [Dysgonomonas hofstadii]